jgi:hypothetical protein
VAAACALFIGALLAACGVTTPSKPVSTKGGADPFASASSAPGSTPSVPVADLRFKCSTFPFGADILTAPARQDQDALTPIAAAVRDEIAGSGGTLPARGWRLIGSDATHAEFVAVDANGSLQVIALSIVNGAWTLDLAGSCYATVVVAEGVGPAQWTWGSPGAPGPTTQTFDALVTERECASGHNATGRIVGPVIVPTADAVLVFFGVHPMPGVQDCQGNPSTRVPVDLGQPLGSRKLRDGGHLPFGDPMNPQP